MTCIWTLFPYTTLFRSRTISGLAAGILTSVDAEAPVVWGQPARGIRVGLAALGDDLAHPSIPGGLLLVNNLSRSEEHTSELQSLRHLVCRLLLEKRKSN